MMIHLQNKMAIKAVALNVEIIDRSPCAMNPFDTELAFFSFSFFCYKDGTSPSESKNLAVGKQKPRRRKAKASPSESISDRTTYARGGSRNGTTRPPFTRRFEGTSSGFDNKKSQDSTVFILNASKIDPKVHLFVFSSTVHGLVYLQWLKL